MSDPYSGEGEGRFTRDAGDRDAEQAGTRRALSEARRINDDKKRGRQQIVEDAEEQSRENAKARERAIAARERAKKEAEEAEQAEGVAREKRVAYNGQKEKHFAAMREAMLLAKRARDEGIRAQLLGQEARQAEGIARRQRLEAEEARLEAEELEQEVEIDDQGLDVLRIILDDGSGDTEGEAREGGRTADTVRRSEPAFVPDRDDAEEAYIRRRGRSRPDERDRRRSRQSWQVHEPA